jgi:phage antirepressor YoqD-like protein
MSNLEAFSGVRVVNGVEMMGSRSLMSICGVGEHFNFVRDLKKLFSIQDLNTASIKGMFIELHEEGNNKGKVKEIWFDRPRASAVAGSYNFEYNLKVHEEFDRLQNQKKLPSNFKEALLALVEAEEDKERLQLEAQKALIHVTRLEGKIEEDKPKVEQWERFLDSKGLISVGDAGKMFGIGRNKFFEMLRDEKLIQKTTTTPYQRFVEQGIFVVVATSNESWGGAVTKVTAKGLDYISKVLRIRLP